MVALAATVDDEHSVEERSSGRLDFDSVYDAWFHEVVRWIGALSGLSGDTDDLAQEVFLVVRRKLPEFDGGNLPAWLYSIAARTVSDWRRRSWFRHLWQKRSSARLDRLPARSLDPAQELERVEARQLLQGLLNRMSPRLRTVFVLYEIEGYSGEEIAVLQRIPAATVRTRLHRARRRFVELASSLQRGNQ
jgi:RNA polymerase sigma-70 factor, ECF subfamily